MNNLTLSELCFIVLEASWQPPNCANKTVLYFSRILSYAGHSKRKCTSEVMEGLKRVNGRGGDGGEGGLDGFLRRDGEGVFVI